MSTDTDKRPVGRPPGTISTPQTLLRSELRNTAATLANLRKLAMEQIDALRKELKKKEIGIAERLAVLEGISSVMERLNKGMENAGKLLINPKAAEPAQSTPTETAVDIHDLIGGAH